MKKTLIYCFLAIAFSFTFLPQNAQVVLSLDEPFSYFAGTSEPDANWFLPEYDDATWERDTGIIGYGYYDEGVPLENIPVSPGASSLYMRYSFEVADKAEFFLGSFLCDYDDGFIAYLNGKEILRINIDKNLDKPAYNDITYRSREMRSYGVDNMPVLGYYLDSMQLDSCLVVGKNVVAVQVLNDSIDGSDLQYGMELYNISDGYYNMYYDAYRYKKQYNPDSTSLPLVIIETDEFGLPYHHIRRTAFMGIIDNGEGKYNRPTDSCNVYYGDVSIQVRGESSKEFPKRSYRLELMDSLENDSNVALLGMPADDDWILLGPMQDKALFRNEMVMDMARNLNGSYQPRSEFCEVFLNGEYVGVYSLMETIKRIKGRLNLAKLRDDEISGIDLTGGYILRFDKGNSPMQIAYPKEENIMDEQKAYIIDYYTEYTDVLLTRYFTDPVTGFRKYINDTSLVDYLIVNEITKNADSYLYSTYFYKDRDDIDPRFHFGPIWDMNLAFGNSKFQYGDRWDEWQFDNSQNTNYQLKIRKLFQDEVLVDLFQERWHAAREGIFQTENLMNYIDSMANYLEEPRIRNYTVWPVIDKDIFNPNYQSMTYEEEILNIKNWLGYRLEWIDSNIDAIFYPLIIPDEIPQSIEDIHFSYDVYPNPFREELIMDINSSTELGVQVELFDMVGRRQFIDLKNIEAGRQQIIMNDHQVQNLADGVYLMRVSVNGNPVSSQRIIKQ